LDLIGKVETFADIYITSDLVRTAVPEEGINSVECADPCDSPELFSLSSFRLSSVPREHTRCKARTSPPEARVAFDSKSASPCI
jgi:hypothetical protein